MPFLTVLGASPDQCMDRARLIMGDEAQIIDTGHKEGVDYFQYDAGPPVQSPLPAFQAGIPGASICVLWVHYHT